MTSGSPARAGASVGTGAGAGSSSGPGLRVSVAANQGIHPHRQEILNSPTSDFPPLNTSSTTSNTNALSPVAAALNTEAGGDAVSSRASSVHDSSMSSTLSESGDSVSSLGGLNHVNDGVGGSTVERRMSRVYSSTDDLQRDQRRRLSKPTVNGQNQQQRQNDQSILAPVLRERILPSGSVVVEEVDLAVEKESCWKTWLRRKVPVYGWLINPGYSLKDLPDDLIAGITISTVVIPQSMAYAMLAPLPPVYGLYTSVVPILIYCLFGTSRHMHTGTFAITTLLLGQAVRGLMAGNGTAGPSSEYSLASILFYDAQSSLSQSPYEDPEHERRFIGMILMLSFVVGFVQVLMSFLRIGGWASKHLLPDALVGGFNTAAVFHIGTSQLKHFLGIKDMPSPQGAFALIKSWIWIGAHFIEETNWHTVFLGSVAIVFMVYMRKMEQRRKAKYELELRKKEMLLVQQRQAISGAIVRSHEEQREQQRQWEQQHPKKSDRGAAMAAPSVATNGTAATSNLSTSPAASNISLRTVQSGNGTGNGHAGSSASFAPVVARTLNDAEQASSPSSNDIPTAAVIEDRQVYVPIPDILMAVILLTLVNVIFALDTPRSEGGWGIDVIGSIPKGLPDIIFPANLITSGPQEWLTLEFVRTVLLPMVQPALLIAVIIYVMSFSIAKQFGKRYGYKVDANQEMLALGLASMGGSIFSGYACTGSLTRTAILSQSGGKTPLASMVGVATVTLTLICLTWCFERVPNCVLAAIVLVALQSLVMQITEPLKLWRLGQRKASLIWTVTFVGVLIVSVELGIAIGIAVVLLSTAYSWGMSKYHGEDDEPLLSHHQAHHQGYRRSPAKRVSQSPLQQTDGQSNGHATAAADVAESLLNSSNGNGVNGQAQRRRVHGSGVHLSASASPASRGADWKTRIMRTKWGGRIGTFLGMERPIFSDTLHSNTDDDDY
ncbi:hypothetical protein EDD11_001282 [Mortierella claussenii]|nr:hypothetical protein EDD11_001282 [Mortierella claussenii]